MHSRAQEYANYWAKTLDESERGAWTIAAAKKYGYRAIPSGGGTKSLIKGNTGTYGGFNCFSMINQNAADVGKVGVIETPPPNASIPQTVLAVAVSFDGTKLTVTWTAHSSHGAKDYARVWISAKTAGVHAQIAAKALATAATADISTFSAKEGKSTPASILVNAEVLVEIEVVNQDTGLASMPSNTAFLRCVVTP